MGTTPIYALPYPAATDPADVPLDMQELADRIETVFRGGVPEYVTALPGSPVDGEEIYFAASDAGGVIWHLRYRAGSASAYKWEFVGGPPLYTEYADTGVFSSTTYLGTLPSLTLPRPGDYMIDHGAKFDALGAATFMAMSYSIGATTASDADWVEFQAGTGGGRASLSRRKRKDGLPAVALIGKYRNSANSAWLQAYLAATPIRIG